MVGEVEFDVSDRWTAKKRLLTKNDRRALLHVGAIGCAMTALIL